MCGQQKVYKTESTGQCNPYTSRVQKTSNVVEQAKFGDTLLHTMKTDFLMTRLTYIHMIGIVLSGVLGGICFYGTIG